MRPLLIIYHSREALPARLAAWLHVARPAGRVDLHEAWKAIGGAAGYDHSGLWVAGSDPQGGKVCAAGRVSRPDVVEHVFHGLAGLFAIDPGAYLLVEVGPAQAWRDLPVILLFRLGLERAARSLAVWCLGRRQRECRSAIEQALRRIAGRSPGEA